MGEDNETIQLRREISRYRSLLTGIADARVRALLHALIREAQERLAAIARAKWPDLRKSA